MTTLQPPNNVPIVSLGERPSVAMARWMTDVSKIIEGAGVSAVNGQTGAVTLDSDDIPEGLVNLYLTAAERITLAGLAGLEGITAAERAKLAGIEAGAQVNAVFSVNGQTGAVYIRETIDGGSASGLSVDYGYRLDGGGADAEYNPLIPGAGGQDANDN